MTKNMQKQKKNKRWLFWVLIVVLLVAVGAGTYLIWNLYSKNQETAERMEEAAQEEESETTEDVTEEEITSEEEMEADRKVKLYEGESPNKAAELTGVITSTAVTNGNLVVRTNIDQYLSEGRCELIVSQDGRKVYGKTTNILKDVTTSYCEDLSVPVAEIGNGTYQLIINLSSGGKTGVINGEATI